MHREQKNRLGVRFDTNLGSFEVELFVKVCPEAVWHFINIAEGREETVERGATFEGFTFHQAVEGDIIYENCPVGWVPKDHLYRKFGDDLTQELRHDSLGLLREKGSEKKLGHDQYYLTMAISSDYDDAPFIIGVVTKGRDVVEKIGTAFIVEGRGGRQTTSYKEVVINSVKILRNWEETHAPFRRHT